MSFDEIVAGMEWEPVSVAIVRECLVEDWDRGHPAVATPARTAAHLVIDDVVDLLRDYWGPRGFDSFVESDRFFE